MRRGEGFGVRESGASGARCPRRDRRARRLLPRLAYSRGRALHQRRPAFATRSCAVPHFDADDQSVPHWNDRGDQAGIMGGELIEGPHAARVAGLIIRIDRGAVEERVVAEQQTAAPEELHAPLEILWERLL